MKPSLWMPVLCLHAKFWARNTIDIKYIFSSFVDTTSIESLMNSHLMFYLIKTVKKQKETLLRIVIIECNGDNGKRWWRHFSLFEAFTLANTVSIFIYGIFLTLHYSANVINVHWMYESNLLLLYCYNGYLHGD